MVICTLRNEGDRIRRAIVCTPASEYFQVSDMRAHNITERADEERAREQHDKLKSALKGSGCEVIDIPELPKHPNSVFTRDPSLCTPEGYIRLRMGLDYRRGEESWIARVLDSLGEPMAGGIEPPGTVEGGDVILAGSVAFLGRSQRTNESGVGQISKLLKAMGYEIRSAVVPAPYLHMGGAMSMLGPDLVLCCQGVFPTDFFDGFDTVEVSAGTFVSGNVICVRRKEAIANASCTDTIDALKEAGVRVHEIDLSEFIKGTGGPSCLIMPVDRSIAQKR